MVGVNRRGHPLVRQKIGRGVFLIALALMEDDLDLYATCMSVEEHSGNRRLGKGVGLHQDRALRIA
jgi:hypothetical protein